MTSVQVSFAPRGTPQHARPADSSGPRAAGGCGCAPPESTEGALSRPRCRAPGFGVQLPFQHTLEPFHEAPRPQPSLDGRGSGNQRLTCPLQARMYLEQVDGKADGQNREEAGGGGEAQAQGAVRTPPSSHSTCLPSKLVLIPSLVRFRRGYSEGDKGEGGCRAGRGGALGPGRPPVLL